MTRKTAVYLHLPRRAAQPRPIAARLRGAAHRGSFTVLLAALVAAAGVALGPAAANEHDNRTIMVSGQGLVTTMPDRALVSLTAESRNTELETARDQVNRVVRDLLRFTRSLGIEDKHVNATAITVRPEYDWRPQTREREFIGYHVARRIDIDLRQLERLGTLIEGAVDRGINQIDEPQLQPGDPAELRRQALALAAEDARLNAVVVAETLAGRIGPARRIVAREEGSPGRPGPMMLEARAVADSSGADTYAAGELRYQARIEVEFDLLVD